MKNCLTSVGVVVLLLAFSTTAHAGEDARPNVLLISLDTLRADHLGCYGYGRETSPFIDELAARGVRFSNAFINCHSTPQSHTTILSSLYQETHAVGMQDLEDWVGAIPEHVPMIQQELALHGYSTIGVTGGGYVSGEIGFHRGFDEFDDVSRDVRRATRRTLELIGRSIDANRDRPIFAFLHTYQIHAPYQPPEEYRTLFGEFQSTIEPTNKRLLQVGHTASTLSPEDLQFLRAMYDGEIRYTDDILRGFFERLEAYGFLKNAVVVITADHGEEFGEHGSLLHHLKLYDELLHVPLIFFGTGVAEGKTIDRLVSSVDIVPTILALVGVEHDLPLAGKDLLVSPSPVPKDEAVFSQIGRSQYAVRTRDWKLITYENPEQAAELYDLRRDPLEQDNVAARNSKRVARMKRTIESWRKQVQQPGEEAPEVTLSPEQIERLRSLGYVD